LTEHCLQNEVVAQSNRLLFHVIPEDALRRDGSSFQSCMGKEQDMMKLPEFCKKYGVSRSAAYREISGGRLRVTHIGRSVRVKTKDAESWFASLPTVGGERTND